MADPILTADKFNQLLNSGMSMDEMVQYEKRLRAEKEMEREQEGPTLMEQGKEIAGNVGGELLKQAATGAAVTAVLGGIGYPVQKKVESIRTLMEANELIDTLGKEMQKLQTQSNLPPEISPQDAMSIMEMKESNMGKATQTRMKVLNTQLSADAAKLRMQSDELERQLFSRGTDLAANFKEAYPVIAKQANKNYGDAMKGIERYFQDHMMNFDKDGFLTTVIDNTIEIAKSEGILDADLQKLVDYRNATTEGGAVLYDAQNRKLPETPPKDYARTPSGKLKRANGDVVIQGGVKSTRPMTFTEAKGTVSNLVRDNPNDAVSAILQEKWGEYLEIYAPKEVKNQLIEVNKNAKPWFQARRKLATVMDPGTGQMDYGKLTKYLIEHSKEVEGTGAQNIFKLVVEGNKIVQKTAELAPKYEQLITTGKASSQTKQTLLMMQRETRDQLSKIALEAEKEGARIMRWREGMAPLIAKQNAAREVAKKNAVFGFAKHLRGAATVGATATRAAVRIGGAALQIMDAAKFAQDPENYLERTLWGLPDLPPQGSREREIQMGRFL